MILCYVISSNYHHELMRYNNINKETHLQKVELLRDV